MKKILKDPILLILGVLLIILAPIFKPGFFSTHDETHIVDVYQMIRSLELGGFPPRFAPDFNFGLGHPYFNFYYQVPFYITTLFYYLGFSMTDGYKYMLGLAVILAALGFYLFLRNHFGKPASVFGTLTYILSPYFAVDLYVRGSPGEMYIFAFFPWAGYLLNKYLKKPTGFNIALTSIAVFLIGISHNVLLPFIYILLFLYGLMIIIILRKGFRNLIKLVIPFLLGIFLAGYYLFPAFAEVRFIATYEQINIADHFPFIKQLIIPHWGYGPSIWGYLDDLSFNIGTVNLLLIFASLLIFKFAKREFKILLIFFWVVFSLAIILSNYRTLFFWESIRVLRLVQFPWRMLLLTTIATSFIAALFIEVLHDKYSKVAPIVTLALLMALIGLNLWHYHPSAHKSITDEKYLELYTANRTLEGSGDRGYLSPEYLNFAEDFIPLTIWQKKRSSTLRGGVKFASDSGILKYSESGLSYDISYNTPVENKVIVEKTFFPGWEAIGNSGTLSIEPYSEYGIIAIPVKEGSGNIKLSFNNTPVRYIANFISAITGAIILVLIIYPLGRRFLK